MTNFLPVPSVSLIDGRPATTSLAIAEHFGKRHDHVIRSIKDLIANCPENFTAPNFGASEYTDETGRKLPMFNVFFDGFILLVMGYTGKKALNMKLAYIAAFNAMREKLEGKKPAPAPESEEERKRRLARERLRRHRERKREQLALPAPKPYREQCAEVVAEMHALHGEFFKVSEKMMNTFAKPFYATALSPIPEHMKPFAHAMNLAINNFWMAMFKDFATLEDLYRAYVEAEKVLNE